uniref:ABC transporter domain-containing protein n=1 Tax=Oryza nivara TaxID=4536 RepID=A0A0E0IT01_ORYNI
MAREIHKIASLRRESSLWRRGDDGVYFSRSSTGASSSRFRDEEDDEEALRWAALERLPTRDRVRRGILLQAAEGNGEKVEVDVGRMGARESRALIARLIRAADDDHALFLLKLKDRMDRVGIDYPTIEVRFEKLEVEAEVHVGNRGLPTLLNSIINTVQAIGNALHISPTRKQPMTVLHDVSGIIKPRRMTLLLGPPGSGKTTLLLALAGKLEDNLKVSGKVTYNGHGMDEFVPQRTAAYISQHDLHIGEMTVRETLAFSARCQGVGSRYDMLTELSRREKAENIKPDQDIDVYMKKNFQAYFSNLKSSNQPRNAALPAFCAGVAHAASRHVSRRWREGGFRGLSFAGAAVSDVVRFGMRLLPSPGLVWRLVAARLMGMWAMAALRRHLCFHLLLLLGHCGCSLVGEGWRRCSPTQLVCSAMLDGAV